MPAEWRGTHFKEPSPFPILVKFIFPNDKLSIQVHPNDAYAATHERAAGGRGKTEMWHIISAEPDAKVLVGLKPGVSKEMFLEALGSSRLEELFVTHEAHRGDTFFLPAGIPHTIGPGMVLCEVQEYSDLTYRIYDYGRVDAQGKPRELHIEKAVEVMDFNSSLVVKTSPLAIKHEYMGLAMMDRGVSILAACQYFAAVEWEISKPARTLSDPEGFRLLVFLSGTGQTVWESGSVSYKPGECWLIPANLGLYSVLPIYPTEYIETFVPYLPSFSKELQGQGFNDDEISKVVFT
jgi:mannose-6-phosphate isomerase